MLELKEEQRTFLEAITIEISNEARELAKSYKIRLLLDTDLAKITQEFAENETPKLVIIAEKYLHPNPLHIVDLKNRLIAIVMQASTSACINLLNS
ncbi:hypothetical protein [Flavobacterium sp. C3NV]|uniref:hypothetical protein n=1 Tax=Flavobacterium sp. C3NV TaxID=3393358 RepID=UPI00398FA98B